MTRFVSLLALLFFGQLATAQHTVVQEIINDINLDSMMLWCGDISGENPVTINGTTDTIFSRHDSKPGNELAFHYLINKLQSFGLEVDSQVFNGSGKNVIARQPGAVHPNRRWLITGHYDSRPLPIAPAADDDGSGTVAVLEAARILSQHEFAYAIEYHIFDMEEDDKIGSKAHAQASGGMGDTLMGVINVDAIAWDGDGDGIARIHTQPIAESEALADTLLAVHDRYNIGLNLVVNNPGATYSDHDSFWNEGFSAVLVIEDFDNDPNIYYHTANDRIEFFDQSYFHKLARLSIGSIATLAEPMEPSGVATIVNAYSLRVYPSPARGRITIERQSGKTTKSRVQLLDITGKQVISTKWQQQAAGREQTDISVDMLPAGLYLIRVQQQAPNGELSTDYKRVIIQ